MTDPIPLTDELLDQWADDRNGPVALHLKQKLVPVEGEGGVIFPPTYADIGYCIDTLSDGTKIAQIDSVGSQANRMEPLFKAARDGEPENPLAKLVPQIEIEIGNQERVSLLDLAHRAGDAVVRSAPGLMEKMEEAFGTLKRTGDAEPLARLAPTSLVFGVWDSRGSSNHKVPRLVRSLIRAYDVEVLHSAAQFNSVWKLLSEEQQNVLLTEEKKPKRHKRSEIGLADAPAVFRNTKLPQQINGQFNQEARVLGGVIPNGDIVREVTVNLVALRSLGAASEERSQILRRYLLGLTLLAATTDQEMYLREGCHLRYAGDEIWQIIPRRGELEAVDLHSEDAQARLYQYAVQYHGKFQPEEPQSPFKFNIKEAKKLLIKKDDGDEA